MRIVLTHPYCWPYARRGNERFIAELGRYLVSREHEVVTVATKPGRGVVEDHQPEGRRILHRQVRIPGMSRLRLQPYHPFLLGVLGSLMRIRADCVHSFHYIDGFAANLARTWAPHRTILQINWPPEPRYYPRIPPDRWLLRRAVLGADARGTISQFCRSIIQTHYGTDATVIPVPVDLDQFAYSPHTKRADRPILLSAASFDNPSKGVRAMIKAFARLKREVPDARLRLSGQMSPQVAAEVLGPLPELVRRDIEVLGVGKLEDLPGLYREANLLVLPSMWEAFGMVVVEAWACGTPVCVTRHGGLVEFLDDRSVAVSFDPQTGPTQTQTANVEGLAEAMRAGLSLSMEDETPPRCRARAEQYSWERLGAAYEKLYVPEGNGA